VTLNSIQRREFDSGSMFELDPMGTVPCCGFHHELGANAGLLHVYSVPVVILFLLCGPSAHLRPF